MKKRLICCLVLVALCLSVFAGCATSFTNDDLVAAIKNLESSVRPIAATAKTPYDVPNKIGDDFYVTDSHGNPATIYVQWKVEGSYQVDLTNNGDTTTVNVPANVDVDYTLKATLVNAKGKAYVNSDKETYTISIACSNHGTVSGDPGNNPGGNNPGGNPSENPGGENPGGNNPGGENPGGNPGGENPGGNTGTTPTSATLDTTGTTNRTSYSTTQVVYSANGITYTQDKAASPTDCYDATGTNNATRAFFGSNITIEYTSNITSIVLQCYGDKCDPGDLTVAGFTITADATAKTVTITFATPGTTFKATNLPKQLRIESITVYTSGTPSTGGNTGGENPGGNTGGENPGGNGEVSGNTITFVMEEQGFTDRANVPASISSNGITIAFDKSTGSTAPSYYTNENGNALRLYGGNKMTISGKTIVKVEFTFVTVNDGTNGITPNTGTFATNTWTGSSSNLTFTIDGTTGHRKIAKIVITYTD